MSTFLQLTAPSITKFVPAAKKAVMGSRNRTSPATAKMQFPTAEKIAYGMFFKFNKIKYEINAAESGAKFSNLTDGAHVFLPLPVSGLIENLGVNYNAQEVGAVMQLINTGANAADMIRDNVTGNPLPGVNQARIEEMGQNVSGAAARGLRQLLNETISGAGAVIDMKTGTVVNPYTLALFQSVAPRVHSFTFRLIPRNAADSRMIREIIRQFQYHSLPGKSPNGLFLTMPSEVEMAFYGTDKLFKFAPSVINNISVNYTALGTNAFFGEDGAPVAVEVTLTFQEVESLTRESYEVDGTGDAFGVGSSASFDG
jgi:hypothetical protein